MIKGSFDAFLELNLRISSWKINISVDTGYHIGFFTGTQNIDQYFNLASGQVAGKKLTTTNSGAIAIVVAEISFEKPQGNRQNTEFLHIGMRDKSRTQYLCFLNAIFARVTIKEGIKIIY